MNREEQVTTPDALRVLVVDDEPSFRVAVAGFLQERQFVVESCESGEEALAMLRQSRFDVVLLDHRLPEMSGINVLQKMHEQKDTTPVVMLTGAGSEMVAAESISLGAYDYLPKERLDLDHLPVTIRGAHERYCFRKEREERALDAGARHRAAEAAEILRSTLGMISHVLNTNLSLASLSVSEIASRILSRIPPDERPTFERTFGDVQQALRLVSSSASSMLALSETVWHRLNGIASTERTEQHLQDLLTTLQTDHGEFMDKGSEEK